jgi:hypothetical protein
MSYDLTIAVFEVKNSLRDGDLQDVCVMRYVRLMDLSRGAALATLMADIKKDFKTDHVRFCFWTDTYTCNGGGPIIMKGNDHDPRDNSKAGRTARRAGKDTR